jgi:hypothetical protein
MIATWLSNSTTAARAVPRLNNGSNIDFKPCILISGPASSLNRHDQRDGLLLGSVVKPRRFIDPVVFHNEVLGSQAIHDSPLPVFYQRRNHPDIGLGAESCILRQSDTAEQGNQEYGQNRQG